MPGHEQLSILSTYNTITGAKTLGQFVRPHRQEQPGDVKTRKNKVFMKYNLLCFQISDTLVGFFTKPEYENKFHKRTNLVQS